MHAKIEKFLSERNHKEISLLAYLYSFLIIISLAMFADTIFGNYDDALIELCAIFFVTGLLYYLHKSGDNRSVSIILVWLATLATFSLAFFNDFRDATALFLWLTPFGFYLVLDRKIVFFHSALYFFLLAILLTYGYNFSQNRLLFDNSDVLTGLSIGTLFVMVIGVFIHFAIEHSFDKLETSNREKEFLLKEIHHRVKNNLNMISSILGLQSDTKDVKLQAMISRNRERIQSIALVHEMLYQDENLDKVDAHIYIKKLSHHIMQAYGKNTISLSLKIDSFFLSLDTMVHLGLMIQEMLVNSLKYAFEAEGNITIILEKKEALIFFLYQDNGKGCAVKSLRKKGHLGVELIEINAQKLKATLIIKSENGVSYEMEFEDANC